MLEITIKIDELWDEVKQEFIPPRETTIRLEHSLVSLSKWESKWCKPFMTKTMKTREEEIDYIKCMTLTQNVDPDIYNYISMENMQMINKYIEAPMTATTFSNDKKKGKNEIVTAELIYYWMIALNIPVEFQKWHLNKLLTLIRVCNIKNQPPEKRSNQAIRNDYAALNAARRKALKTKG